MSEWIPDPDLFMMCRSPEPQEFTALPAGFYFDLCREEELDIWRAFPFDEKDAAQEFSAYMKQYFDEVYRPKGDLFFSKCLFVRNAEGVPVATGFLWKAYDRINTLHWLKVKKKWEDRGIGRALISRLLSELGSTDFPIYLHTQASSYRAIKLYTDFGFELITDPFVGDRKNGLEEGQRLLKQSMRPEDWIRLRFTSAPAQFLETVRSSAIHEF